MVYKILIDPSTGQPLEVPWKEGGDEVFTNPSHSFPIVHVTVCNIYEVPNSLHKIKYCLQIFSSKYCTGNFPKTVEILYVSEICVFVILLKNGRINFF